MGRHSKNAGGRALFSRSETKHAIKAGAFGSKKLRMGADSMTQLGMCSLSLKPYGAKCVATPSGHLYDKAALYEYILKEKKILKRRRKKMKEDIAEQEEASKNNKAKKTVGIPEHLKSEHDKQKEEELLADQARTTLQKQALGLSEKEKLEGLHRTSYWLNHKLDEHVPQVFDLASIPKHPPSPMSGKPLRVKDLADVEFDTATGKQPGDVGYYLCPCSNKELNHQKLILIKKTGKVFSEESFSLLAKPSMTCPITGKTFDDKDVLELVGSGTAYAAHNDVTSSVWRPGK